MEAQDNNTKISCEEIYGQMLEDHVNSSIPPRPVKALIIMLACFSILGLLGNSLVLYVYVRKRNKLSSTVFIIALAAIDLVTSAVGMPYTMVMEGLNYQVSTDFSCKLYYFVITCTVPFSVFIMVAIAIDRYLCICRPHSHVLDSVRARNSVLVLLVVAVLIGVESSMFHGVYQHKDDLQKHAKGPQPVEMTIKDSMGNFSSEMFTLLGPDSCPDCVNHSSSTDDGLTAHLMQVIMELYISVCTKEHSQNETYLYTGHCLNNQVIFTDNFRRTFQTIYSSSFLVCFSVVFVLYILIYRSILVRRSRRLAARTKNKLHITQEVSLTENQSMLNDSPDKSIAMTDISNGSKAKSSFSNRNQQRQQSQHLLQQQQQHQQPQPSQQVEQKGSNQTNGCLRDKYFLANIRTAIMLFVVTLAFIIAYLPSWLMAHKVLKFNVLVFYVYFSNHIVNPIIYAFMNPAFRRSLTGLLCRKKGRAV